MSCDEQQPAAPSPPVAGADEGPPSAQGLGALVQAVDAALSDASVQRLATLGTEWLGVAGSCEVRELGEALLPMLPRVTAFVDRIRPAVDAGLLDQVADLLLLLRAALDALTPAQAERLASEAEHLVTLANTVMVENPARAWRSGMGQVISTWQQTKASPETVGLRELIRLRRDPAVQHLLRALLALVHEEGALGQRN